MGKKKPCLTCKINVEANMASTNEKVIPEWMKKAGIYSLLPKQLNCMDKYNANKVELVEEKPEITGIEVALEVNKLKKNNYDCIILAVGHNFYKKIGFNKIKNFSSKKISYFFDLKNIFHNNKNDYQL